MSNCCLLFGEGPDSPVSAPQEAHSAKRVQPSRGDLVIIYEGNDIPIGIWYHSYHHTLPRFSYARVVNVRTNSFIVSTDPFLHSVIQGLLCLFQGSQYNSFLFVLSLCSFQSGVVSYLACFSFQDHRRLSKSCRFDGHIFSFFVWTAHQILFLQTMATPHYPT